MISLSFKKYFQEQNGFGVDAGNRSRVSEITTLLDGKVLNEDDVFLFQNIGTGTATYANNKVTLTVGPGQYMIRQSKRFCPYFSGKSQLIETTFDTFQIQTGYVKRVGYFSSNAVAPFETSYDGFFIESDGILDKYFIKCFRSGVETFSLDITARATTYDFSKFTVLAHDFLWLGGAEFRSFLRTQNGFELISQYIHAGVSDDVFMLSPNQPVRYEIRAGVGATGTASLRYVCCEVASEGSIDEAGKTLGLLNYTSVTTNAINTIYALKSIRKVAQFRDIAIQIIDFSVSNTATSDAGVLMMIVNPTLSAGSMTYTANSKIQEGNPTAGPQPTITAGTGRVVGAVSVGTSGASSIMKENFLSFLSSNIDNSMDTYFLAYMPTTTNQSVNGVINLKEF